MSDSGGGALARPRCPSCSDRDRARWTDREFCARCDYALNVLHCAGVSRVDVEGNVTAVDHDSRSLDVSLFRRHIVHNVGPRDCQYACLEVQRAAHLSTIWAIESVAESTDLRYSL